MYQRTVDDRHTITTEKAEDIIRKIAVSYVQLHRSFLKEESHINALLDQGKANAAIREMLNVFQIPNDIVKRVGFNARIKGIPKENAPAALLSEYSERTGRLVNATILFSFSKDQLTQGLRRRMLHLIAHEIAHVRLALDLHELRGSEFATDMLAHLVVGEVSDFFDIERSISSKLGYTRPELYQTVSLCVTEHSKIIYL